VQISAEVMGILGRAETDGNCLRFGQVDRAEYVAVNKVLEAAGGKWSRRDRGHVFQEDAGPVLAGLLAGGQVATPAEAGWFPTPPAVVALMLDAAALEPGLEVLEPSAGTGAIAGPAAGRGCLVDVIEQDESRAGVLISAGYARTVAQADFLTVEARPAYHRVIMNPPFSGKADIAHVLHAVRFLRPGGLLVAVMSGGTEFRSDKRTAGFRDLVEQAGGTITRLPDGAFHESGTDIRTVLVTLPAVAVAAPVTVPAEPERGRLTRDDKRAYMDEKREQARAFMAKGMDKMTDPAFWAAYLGRGDALGRLSLRNQMLLIMQYGGVSDVAGRVDWQERGRQVRDGEVELLIFAPRTRAVPANGEKRAPVDGEDTVRAMCGTKIARVYDISQTDPMPGRVFKPAASAAGKSLAEIRDAVKAIGGDDADKILAAMERGAILHVQAAVDAVAVADDERDDLDDDGGEFEAFNPDELASEAQELLFA
jgi:predicted RNA methylase